MPGLVVHALFPLLVLLSIPRLDRRKVWILWPLTFLPDLDYFLTTGLHRAATGNLFVVLPFALVFAWSMWGRERRPALAQWMTISMIYLLGHMLMDVFQGGSVLLWPLSNYTYCYYAGIDVVTATDQLQPYFEACSFEGIPTVSPVYPWISPLEGAILAFVLPAGAIMAGLNLRAYLRRRDGPDST